MILKKIKLVSQRCFGMIYSADFLPCPFKGKDFYDVLLLETERGSVFCKLNALHKPKNHLKVEFKINKHLFSLGFPVPEPLFYFGGSAVVDREMAFYDFIDDATTLRSSDLNDDSIINTIALSLKNLHSVQNTDAVGFVRDFGSNEIQIDFISKFEKKRKKLFKGLDRNLFDSFKKVEIFYRRQVSELDSSASYVLCKKDLHKGNWLIGGNKKLYFIDNEFLQFAPLAFDLFEVFTNLFEEGSQREKFIEFYGRVAFKESHYDKIAPLIATLKMMSLFITSHDTAHLDLDLYDRAKGLLFDLSRYPNVVPDSWHVYT